MATFVVRNSDGVKKKKPMIILKEFIFFVLVSTSGAGISTRLPETGRRARIHTEIREQPSFFIKL